MGDKVEAKHFKIQFQLKSLVVGTTPETKAEI